MVAGLLLLGVLHGLRDGLVAVDADGHQVKDGGGGADHVHGDVGVAQRKGKRPQLEHLQREGNDIFSIWGMEEKKNHPLCCGAHEIPFDHRVWRKIKSCLPTLRATRAHMHTRSALPPVLG